MFDEKEIEEYVDYCIESIINIIKEYKPILIAGDGISKGE